MNKTAEVVVIGGGVVGCSIAYHLAKNGCRDVVVLERNFLASGSTGRCGAGVRQQWGTEMNCRLSTGSCRDLENMNEELAYDGDIEFTQGGYLLVAYTEHQVEQFKKNVILQNSLGINSRLVTPEQAKEIVPHLNTEGLLAATFYQKDGHANPFHVTQAYADAARRLGVKIYTHTNVTGIRREHGRVVAVETNQGEISTSVVVDAGGGYAGVIAEMVGLQLPTYSERHQILVTEPVEPMQGPMVMSFHHGTYCQQSPHGSFIMGLGDPHEKPGFNTRSSWQFLQEMARKITWMLPPLAHLRIVRQWAGLYHMTPDRQPIIGEMPTVPGFHLALLCSGHGFMIALMTGRLIAQNILGLPLEMPIDMLGLDRFAKGQLILEPSVV